MDMLAVLVSNISLKETSFYEKSDWLIEKRQIIYELHLPLVYENNTLKIAVDSDYSKGQFLQTLLILHSHLQNKILVTFLHLIIFNFLKL
ncbi:hypothetical protein T4A_12321 [Trichinella pseudospiralis]|uniref:Uncharacterized protein n=1 Tax=Trichinella pseudospiralis TaxID=6337 RepID=A0A0V1EJ55_TRIPS|nr:hypothetical protein T4A_12321 [Trichinella pseudospiralis]KRZ37548.1 hypothetical protein T4C_11041 [Trichinella pseudospiralis]